MSAERLYPKNKSENPKRQARFPREVEFSIESNQADDYFPKIRLQLKRIFGDHVARQS